MSEEYDRKAMSGYRKLLEAEVGKLQKENELLKQELSDRQKRKNVVCSKCKHLVKRQMFLERKESGEQVYSNEYRCEHLNNLESLSWLIQQPLLKPEEKNMDNDCADYDEIDND